MGKVPRIYPLHQRGSGRGITQERMGTKLGELEGTNVFGINLAGSEVKLHEHINLGGADGSIGILGLTLDEEQVVEVDDSEIYTLSNCSGSLGGRQKGHSIQTVVPR